MNGMLEADRATSAMVALLTMQGYTLVSEESNQVRILYVLEKDGVRLEISGVVV